MAKPFVVVLVARPTELEAAGRLIEKHFREQRHPFSENLYLLEFDRVFLLIQRLEWMGNIDAAISTAEVIRQYRPICVVGAGFCCGTQVRTSPRKFCDIVVADRVVYYEPSKKGSPQGGVAVVGYRL